MKRFFCMLLAVTFLLCGCGLTSNRLKEPVTFYYLQDVYSYNGDGGVIGSEQREASGHNDDLAYLLALYLMGPSEENLRSPIPLGTNIFSVKLVDGKTIELQLSDTSANMTDADFTLACACLTLTCLDLPYLANADTVTVFSGSRSVTMNRDNLVLLDTSITPPAATKEETP